MADNVNSEIIGGIGVTLTGDYSSLQSSYAAAQVQAQQAGTAVADAFNTGVASVSDAAQVVSGSLAAIEPAAAGAAGSLQQFSGAAQSAGDAAQTSEGSLASLGAQLTAIGEALAITAGLKAFAQSALDASDSITRADIALTTMTGSADKADETIKELEDLGMQDGLSFPSLLTAAQRMTALLPPGTDVVNVIGHIADGAAAMGVSIEQAANRFDMIVNAGFLSSRALTSMGLSLDSVVTSMQHVTGASDVTTQNVTTMFKALDPGERVQVLVDALTKLGGTAEQVAQQTFGGQWQQLANAWQEVMISVGQAILPVISDLVDFTKTDIAPFIKELADGFNSLPGPIRDTAVGVGIAAAALVPLTGALAAAAIGISGLSDAAEILGLKSAAAAEAQTAETAASIAQGAAATEAATEVEAAGVVAEGAASIIGIGLVAGLTAAALGFTDLKAAIKGAQDQWAQGAGFKDAATFVAAANAQIEQEIKDLATAQLSTEDAANATKTFTDYLNQGVINGSQFAEAVKNIAAAVRNLKQQDIAQIGSDLRNTFGAITVSTEQASAGVIALFTNQQKLDSEYKTAKQVYDEALQSFTNGTPVYHGLAVNAQELAIAQQNMDAAAKAAGITIGAEAGSYQAVTEAAGKLADQTKVVVSAQQQQANEQAVANASLDLATHAYNASEIALEALTAKLHDAQAANDGSVTATQRVISAEQDVQKAYAANQKALQDLQTTQENWTTKTTADIQAAAQKQLDGLEQVAAAVGPTVSAWTGLDDEINKLAATLPNFGVVTVNLSTGPLAGLQSALAEASAKVADLSAKMAEGENVGQQYQKALKAQLDAQVALDEETAVLATGLQGATDSYSLARDAVAAAQAKVNDLTIAFQSGLATYAQVQSAQKALTTAQQALNKETGDASNLVDALSNSYPQLAANTNTATTAIQQQTTALQQDLSALQSVGAAVKSVESDMQAAFGSTATSGGTVGAPPGYTLAGILTGGGDFGTRQYSYGIYGDAATEAAFAKATEQGLYDQGYTPQAIAKATGDTLTNVLANLGLKPDQAGITKAMASGGTGSGTQQGGVLFGAQPPGLSAGLGLGGSGGTVSTGASGGTTETLAQATQALQIADAMLNAAEQIGDATMIATAQQAVSTANQAYASAGGFIGFGATNTPGSVSGNAPVAATAGAPLPSSGGGGTAAIDGGSYPAVTAHQATGEVWAVTTSGGGGIVGGGGATTQIVQQIANTVTQTTTAAGGGSLANDSAIGGLVQVIGSTASSTGDAASAMQQVATAISGLVSLIATGSIVSSGPAATVTGGSGTAYASTPATYTSPSQGPGVSGTGASLLPVPGNKTNSVPGYNPLSGGTTTSPSTVPSDSSTTLAEATVALQQADALLVTAELSGNQQAITTAQTNDDKAYQAYLAAGGHPRSSRQLGTGSLPTSSPLPTSSTSSGGNLSSSTIHANITINVNGSSNPAQVAQQTATTLVAQLRAAGARF